MFIAFLNKGENSNNDQEDVFEQEEAFEPDDGYRLSYILQEF